MEFGKVIDHGAPARQFSVMLPNRSGALASLVRLLRNSAIEVVGLSVQDSRDVTIARMMVSDPDATSTLFIEKGIPHTECEMVVVGLRESGPGLLQCLEVLMAAEINVDFAYALLTESAGHSLLALRVEDFGFTVSLLHTSGFKVLYQEDLSR
ncbi:MAG: acetolactate synthase [Verrucomicrobia bacterium]|nr:acetolactate synthase [Verrucomicrobiota bacterium]